jgi:hypothetical protein
VNSVERFQEKKTHRVGIWAVFIASIPFQILEITVLFFRTDVLNIVPDYIGVGLAILFAFSGLSLGFGLAFYALDLIRRLIDRRTTRPAFRRRLQKNLVPTIITVLGGAVIASFFIYTFFTRQFVNPEMVDWALFITLGCLIWWTIALIVSLVHIATNPAVNPPKKPTKLEYTSSRRKWNHGIRKLVSVVTHPLVMPGYVIGIAVFMNAQWIGHVIDLSASSVLAGWVVLAVIISPLVRLGRVMTRLLWVLMTLSFLVFPFALTKAPQLTTTLRQHSLIVRHVLKLNRFIPVIQAE